jgi:hypothetical protein
MTFWLALQLCGNAGISGNLALPAFGGGPAVGG